MQLGKRAKIFVPSVASPEKMERIRGCGADLVVTGDRYADALVASEEWIRQSGALPIHAYDQIETLLGQGTVGLEFEEQDPILDTLLVAVGGGGLIGGIAAWYAGRIKVVGVEPETAPTLTRALQSGHPVDAEAGGIAADSLAPGRRTNVPNCPEICQQRDIGAGRSNPPGTAIALADLACRDRTGWCRGFRCALVRTVPAQGWGTHWRFGMRRKHHSRRLRSGLIGSRPANRSAIGSDGGVYQSCEICTPSSLNFLIVTVCSIA